MLNPAIFNQIDIPRVKTAEDLLKEQLGISQARETMQGMQDARTEKNALRQLLSSGNTGESLEDSLVRGGFLKHAQDARKSRLDAAQTTEETALKKAQTLKSGADTRKTELDNAEKKLMFVNQVIGSAVDQNSYTQGRAALAQSGIDIANIPEAFDPGQVKAAGQQTMTALQRIQEIRAQDIANQQKLNQDETRAETRTNNERTDRRIVSEGALGRGVAMRGQNMTDARAKDGERAPVLTTIVDPSNPSRMITVNARAYNQATGEGIVGVSGKEPTAAKKAEQEDLGKSNLSGTLANLRDMYSQLDKGGGIQSADKGTISNITSRIQSTGLGQAAGQFAGTKNQRLRDSIEQQRPLLLQAIKQSTGMSAKQMDSNAEMKLFLAAATDPTKDVKANMEALENLERMFARGYQPKLPTQSKPSTLPKGWSVEVE